MKVGVLASGAGTNLQAILDRVHGREGVEVVAVASDQPERPRSTVRRAPACRTGVFPVEEDRRVRDAAIADFLERHGVELVVLAGYMALLDPAFLGRFPPRGQRPSRAAAGLPRPACDRAGPRLRVKVFGVTVHFVDEGVDTGPVIAQRAIELPTRSTRRPSATRCGRSSTTCCARSSP